MYSCVCCACITVSQSFHVIALNWSLLAESQRNERSKVATATQPHIRSRGESGDSGNKTVIAKKRMTAAEAETERGLRTNKTKPAFLQIASEWMNSHDTTQVNGIQLPTPSTSSGIRNHWSLQRKKNKQCSMKLRREMWSIRLLLFSFEIWNIVDATHWIIINCGHGGNSRAMCVYAIKRLLKVEIQSPWS